MQAVTTNFDVRTVRGIAQYHGAFLAKSEARVKAKSEESARRKGAQIEHREEQLRVRYEAFKLDQLTQIRASLSPEVLADLEAQVLAKLRQQPFRFKGGEDRLIRIALNDHLAEENGIPSFEDWKTGLA